MVLSRRKYCLIFLLISLSITACSSEPKHFNSGKSEINPGTVIKIARAQLGTNYKYGGLSPEEGFDCSGLVYYSFLQAAGIRLPRTSIAQYQSTKPVTRRQLKPGDLLFFRITRARISHVAIYVGKNRFIHAPSSGKSVTIASLDNPYWRKRFVRGGRI